jgi:hypothetical protein
MNNPVLLPPAIDEVPPPGISIVEELDKRLMVQLRDGRKVFGILRSFDQFANLILESKIAMLFGLIIANSMFRFTSLSFAYFAN